MNSLTPRLAAALFLCAATAAAALQILCPEGGRLDGADAGVCSATPTGSPLSPVQPAAMHRPPG